MQEVNPIKDHVNIHEAKTHLSRLIRRVLGGEEITIAKAGTPVARLVPIEPARRERTPGSAAGEIEISPAFYDPLPDEVLEAFQA